MQTQNGEPDAGFFGLNLTCIVVVGIVSGTVTAFA